MSVEVNPVGLRCGAQNGGLSCQYCYEIPVAGANDVVKPLNFERVKVAVEREQDPQGFSLFGGEPLLAPIETLEKLWAWGLERYGKNGVQTGGRPITEEHHALFHRYKVNVSFSIDGPGELNDARRAGSLAKTREVTSKILSTMDRCIAEGTCSSAIVTLHRMNAYGDRLPVLCAWLEELSRKGVSSVNLHALEHDGAFRNLELSHDETVAAFLACWDVAQRCIGRTDFQPFRDIIALLTGRDRWRWNDGTAGGVSCIWTGCDPMTTPAVRGVEADGTRSICQRVNKKGVRWAEATRGPLVRQLALRSTPFDQGGCRGCRQMITCKGQCPGTAIGGDWRKRSRDCETWMRLLEHFEGVLTSRGVTPVTLRPDRDAIEERMASWWAAGRAVSIADVLTGSLPEGRGDDHQDHADHDDHDDLGRALLAFPGEVVR